MMVKSGPCKTALAGQSVCETANTFLEHRMSGRHLEATSVVQNVRTGALVAFASSHPTHLDVATNILPLSFSKVFIAASWWDHKQPDRMFETHGQASDPNPAFRKWVSIHNVLVGGSDAAGEQMAVALRHAIGSQAVMDDLERYGFDSSGQPFWAYVDPSWKTRLTPARTSLSLAALNDQQWAAALSIGETHMLTTPLAISRFLQAIGNDGLQCRPVAKRSGTATIERPCSHPKQILHPDTAMQIRNAMLDTVNHGTADHIAEAMTGTGWSIGGKTGTGGRVGSPLNLQDGCFAGLIFDNHGKARFTVVTFVRKGGIGGGNAAEISAAIARFLAVKGAGD
jgi:cell division protein FtsI/penicillin-binding protein 2